MSSSEKKPKILRVRKRVNNVAKENILSNSCVLNNEESFNVQNQQQIQTHSLDELLFEQNANNSSLVVEKQNELGLQKHTEIQQSDRELLLDNYLATNNTDAGEGSSVMFAQDFIDQLQLSLGPGEPSKTVGTQTISSACNTPGYIASNVDCTATVTNDICGECFERVTDVNSVTSGGAILLSCKCGSVNRFHYLCVYIAYEKSIYSELSSYAYVKCMICQTEIPDMHYISARTQDFRIEEDRKKLFSANDYKKRILYAKFVAMEDLKTENQSLLRRLKDCEEELDSIHRRKMEKFELYVKKYKQERRAYRK